tara:strand:- start:28 stop:210 length:183 start_codon:yes stop_codon:yes gene_type:complete
MITPVKCCHCRRGVEIEGTIISKEMMDNIYSYFNNGTHTIPLDELWEYVEAKYLEINRED